MTRRSPYEIGEDLRRWLADNDMTEQQLTDQINKGRLKKDWISQSWISRICSGRFKRASRQVSVVLGYKNILFYTEKVIDPAGWKAIEEAIDEVWDGSAENARVIARLLRTAGSLHARRSQQGGNVDDRTTR